MHLRPLHIAGLYLTTILLFAFLYYLRQDQFDCLSTPLDSIYFSVVTITTLGYGDISPIGQVGKILVLLQAILGVFALGLLFVSVSDSISRGAVERQKLASKQNFFVRYQEFRSNIELAILVYLGVDFLQETNEPIELFDSREYFNTFEINEQLTTEHAVFLLTKTNFFKLVKRHTRALERDIEAFIYSNIIDDVKALQQLSAFRDKLHRLQDINLDNQEDARVGDQAMCMAMAFQFYDLFKSCHAFRDEYDEDSLLYLVNRC